MVAAVREKDILAGKRVERRESGEPGDFEKLEQMRPQTSPLLAKRRTWAALRTFITRLEKEAREREPKRS